MNKKRIYNADIDDTIPPDAVLIDKTTPWGNPYRVGPDGNFEQVKKLYIDYLLANPALVEDIKLNLKNKDLVCHCRPSPCHAEILILIAGDPNFKLESVL